jgi:SpoVK/Ycf46/Vps4 family AAA+-type ATPase
MCFTGAPGTGKTTVARLLGAIYKKIGVLKQGHFIEVDRAGLVGGYLGQTALKTKEVCEKALGGVLFIDEAYTLFRQNSNSSDGYGLEAIDTILKYMEDNRGEIAVIFAGYKEEMEHFVSSNPGLESRINRFLHFEDYSDSELLQIANSMLSETNMNISNEALNQIVFKASSQRNKKSFANARTVRNIIEDVFRKQSLRLYQSSEDLDKLSEEELHKIIYDDVA